MRAVSRLFSRRLPPVTADASVVDPLQTPYKVNRIRGMQSLVPMARTVLVSRQQVLINYKLLIFATYSFSVYSQLFLLSHQPLSK